MEINKRKIFWILIILFIIGITFFLFSKNNYVPANNILESRIFDIASTTNNKNENLLEQESKKQQQKSNLVNVVSIVDGDTIKVSIDGKSTTIRLIGIDTPETVDPRKIVQCFGIEASNKAKELLSGRKVSIEQDPTQGELDKYGRLLAYVYRDDGLFYNDFMIKQGFAHEYTYNAPYKYQQQFKTDQKYAQDNKLGLWSPNTCNGDTTADVSTSSEPTKINTTTNVVNNVVPITTIVQTQSQTQTGAKYYTSSYGTSKYYYPELCDSWKSLSTKYLKSFDSLDALLSVYPSRTLSPQCK